MTHISRLWFLRLHNCCPNMEVRLYMQNMYMYMYIHCIYNFGHIQLSKYQNHNGDRNLAGTSSQGPALVLFSAN